MRQYINGFLLVSKVKKYWLANIQYRHVTAVAQGIYVFSNLCGRSIGRYIDVSDTFLSSLPYQYRLVFRILKGKKRSHHETFELTLPNLLRANVLYRESCVLSIFPKIGGEALRIYFSFEDGICVWTSLSEMCPSWGH